MYIREIDELQRSLDADVAIFDRESITKWLMQFSSGLPLKLSHPVIGNISYQGIRFAGSVVPAYDRYVTRVIEDLVEKHVRGVEAAMVVADPDHLQEIAPRADRLDRHDSSKAPWPREQQSRDGLAANRAIPGRRSLFASARINQIQVAARLNARLAELKKNFLKKLHGAGWKISSKRNLRFVQCDRRRLRICIGDRDNDCGQAAGIPLN